MAPGTTVNQTKMEIGMQKDHIKTNYICCIFSYKNYNVLKKILSKIK